MKYIVLRCAFILTGFLSFNLFAQSAQTDGDATVHEIYTCTKEASDPITYQLFKPGQSDDRICELRVTTISGATITTTTWPQEYQLPNSTWPAEPKNFDNFCSEMLETLFLKVTRKGYLCGRESN